jgi:opacity protein-like surface antigen
MKRSFFFAPLLFLAVFGTAPGANAQEATSKIDVYGGYDYVRFNVHSNVAGVPPIETFNADGGSGELAFNANNWIGVVGDLGGYYVSTPPRAGAFSYLLGPRVNFRRGLVTPFAQTIFGALLATGGIGQSGAQNHFAMAVGGGMEFNVSEHVAIRPVEADYFMTKFPDGLQNRQNNFRFGAGLVFRFNKG